MSGRIDRILFEESVEGFNYLHQKLDPFAVENIKMFVIRLRQNECLPISYKIKSIRLSFVLIIKKYNL